MGSVTITRERSPRPRREPGAHRHPWRVACVCARGQWFNHAIVPGGRLTQTSTQISQVAIVLTVAYGNTHSDCFLRVRAYPSLALRAPLYPSLALGALCSRLRSRSGDAHGCNAFSPREL